MVLGDKVLIPERVSKRGREIVYQRIVLARLNGDLLKFDLRRERDVRVKETKRLIADFYNIPDPEDVILYDLLGSEWKDPDPEITAEMDHTNRAKKGLLGLSGVMRQKKQAKILQQHKDMMKKLKDKLKKARLEERKKHLGLDGEEEEDEGEEDGEREGKDKDADKGGDKKKKGSAAASASPSASPSPGATSSAAPSTRNSSPDASTLREEEDDYLEEKPSLAGNYLIDRRFIAQLLKEGHPDAPKREGESEVDMARTISGQTVEHVLLVQDQEPQAEVQLLANTTTQTEHKEQTVTVLADGSTQIVETQVRVTNIYDRTSCWSHHNIKTDVLAETQFLSADVSPPGGLYLHKPIVETQHGQSIGAVDVDDLVEAQLQRNVKDMEAAGIAVNTDVEELRTSAQAARGDKISDEEIQATQIAEAIEEDPEYLRALESEKVALLAKGRVGGGQEEEEDTAVDGSPAAPKKKYMVDAANAQKKRKREWEEAQRKKREELEKLLADERALRARIDAERRERKRKKLEAKKKREQELLGQFGIQDPDAEYEEVSEYEEVEVETDVETEVEEMGEDGILRKVRKKVRRKVKRQQKTGRKVKRLKVKPAAGDEAGAEGGARSGRRKLRDAAGLFEKSANQIAQEERFIAKFNEYLEAKAKEMARQLAEEEMVDSEEERERLRQEELAWKEQRVDEILEQLRDERRKKPKLVKGLRQWTRNLDEGRRTQAVREMRKAFGDEAGLGREGEQDDDQDNSYFAEDEFDEEDDEDDEEELDESTESDREAGRQIKASLSRGATLHEGLESLLNEMEPETEESSEDEGAEGLGEVSLTAVDSVVGEMKSGAGISGKKMKSNNGKSSSEHKRTKLPPLTSKSPADHHDAGKETSKRGSKSASKEAASQQNRFPPFPFEGSSPKRRRPSSANAYLSQPTTELNIHERHPELFPETSPFGFGTNIKKRTQLLHQTTRQLHPELYDAETGELRSDLEVGKDIIHWQQKFPSPKFPDGVSKLLPVKSRDALVLNTNAIRFQVGEIVHWASPLEAVSPRHLPLVPPMKFLHPDGRRNPKPFYPLVGPPRRMVDEVGMPKQEFWSRKLKEYEQEQLKEVEEIRKAIEKERVPAVLRRERGRQLKDRVRARLKFMKQMSRMMGTSLEATYRKKSGESEGQVGGPEEGGGGGGMFGGAGGLKGFLAMARASKMLPGGADSDKESPSGSPGSSPTGGFRSILKALKTQIKTEEEEAEKEALPVGDGAEQKATDVQGAPNDAQLATEQENAVTSRSVSEELDLNEEKLAKTLLEEEERLLDETKDMELNLSLQRQSTLIPGSDHLLAEEAASPFVDEQVMQLMSEMNTKLDNQGVLIPDLTDVDPTRRQTGSGGTDAELLPAAIPEGMQDGTASPPARDAATLRALMVSRFRQVKFLQSARQNFGATEKELFGDQVDFYVGPEKKRRIEKLRNIHQHLLAPRELAKVMQSYEIPCKWEPLDDRTLLKDVGFTAVFVIRDKKMFAHWDAELEGHVDRVIEDSKKAAQAKRKAAAESKKAGKSGKSNSKSPGADKKGKRKKGAKEGGGGALSLADFAQSDSDEPQYTPRGQRLMFPDPEHPGRLRPPSPRPLSSQKLHPSLLCDQAIRGRYSSTTNVVPGADKPPFVMHQWFAVAKMSTGKKGGKEEKKSKKANKSPGSEKSKGGKDKKKKKK
eukprot:g7912.t1